MEIDEKFILEVWEKEIKKKKNVFEDVEEYKKMLRKAERCEESVRNALQPCDHDLLENYKDTLSELRDISEYISYRAGFRCMLGLFNIAFDDWNGKAVIKMIDGEPCICIEDETAPDE